MGSQPITSSLFSIAADAMLILHAAFIVFVIGGLLAVLIGRFAGWEWIRNPGWRLAHLLSIGIVVLQSWLGIICPLTVWEKNFRIRAGEPAYETSFIEFWLGQLIFYDFPAWVFISAYTVFGMVVAASWIWAKPRPFH